MLENRQIYSFGEAKLFATNPVLKTIFEILIFNDSDYAR